MAFKRWDNKLSCKKVNAVYIPPENELAIPNIWFF
jgi:hypothetical protein